LNDCRQCDPLGQPDEVLGRFGWDVCERKRRDSEVQRIAEREETAKRRSQAPNGSATRMRDVKRRDERAFCEVERAWSQGKEGRPEALERSKVRVGQGGAASIRLYVTAGDEISDASV
jgi:hypothetical protein